MAIRLAFRSSASRENIVPAGSGFSVTPPTPVAMAVRVPGMRISPQSRCATYKAPSQLTVTVPPFTPSEVVTPPQTRRNLKQELSSELSSLREELQEEKSRSRAISERLRSELRAIDAELNIEPSPSQPTEDSSSSCSPDLPVNVSRLSDTLDASAMSPLVMKGGDALAMAEEECGEEATSAATTLALALHESVRSLMQQGMEFRALAVRREATLKAALEASERARLHAEERLMSPSSSSTLRQPLVHDRAGSETSFVSTEKHTTCQALNVRLEAQVRTLQLQVERMGGDLKNSVQESIDWQRKHSEAVRSMEVLQQDRRELQARLWSFEEKGAEACPTMAIVTSRNMDDSIPATRSSPQTSPTSPPEGCGLEGPAVSPVLSATESAFRQASQAIAADGSLRSPAWTVAANRTALCAQVRGCSPVAATASTSNMTATPQALTESPSVDRKSFGVCQIGASVDIFSKTSDAWFLGTITKLGEHKMVLVEFTASDGLVKEKWIPSDHPELRIYGMPLAAQESSTASTSDELNLRVPVLGQCESPTGEQALPFSPSHLGSALADGGVRLHRADSEAPSEAVDPAALTLGGSLEEVRSRVAELQDLASSSDGGDSSTLPSPLTPPRILGPPIVMQFKDK